MIGGVVRPQFDTCALIVCGEIECIANEEVHVFSRISKNFTGLNLDLPIRLVGSVVRPQLRPCAGSGVEINGISDEDLHPQSRQSELTRIEIGHLPRRIISVRCRACVLERDVGHGLANEEFGSSGAGRHGLDADARAEMNAVATGDRSVDALTGGQVPRIAHGHGFWFPLENRVTVSYTHLTLPTIVGV